MSAIARARRRGERAISIGLGRPSAKARPPTLTVPLGAKLELTHRCNLRCAFCYTDSPRRTLERPAELTDEQWMTIVEEILELGVLETVVSGGEPLLRRDLALSIAERLGRAGVAVRLSTNGWHVDEDAADRLAAVPGLRVNISIDGPTPAVHDRSRGVPGGWRRAVVAIDRLAARGVGVEVVHVLLPGAQDQAEPLLWQMWSLGADRVRMTSISPTGAAAEGSWRTELGEARRLAASGAPPLMAVTIANGVLRDPAPAFLVRPNGDVVPDSQRPIVFGHALEDGLSAVWERLAAGAGAAVAPQGHVGYADPDVRLDGRRPVPRPTGPAAAVIEDRVQRSREKARRRGGEGDLDAANAFVRELALSRRHALAAVRRGARDANGEHVRVAASRHVHHLNATASRILDSAIDGTLQDAVDQLAVAHLAASRERLVHDVLHVARDLRARGVMVPARPSGT